MRVLLSTYGGRGDVEPVVGPAVRLPLRVLGTEVRAYASAGWAERPAGWAEGRQPQVRTPPASGSTNGSTELEVPVIRSAGAVRRSTAASEVSQ